MPLSEDSTIMSANKMPNLARIVISLGILSFSAQSISCAADGNKADKVKVVQAAAQHEGDSSGVKAQIALLNKALMEGDAKALAAVWSDDAEYIDEDGSITKGKASLEKRFANIFVQNGKQLVDLVPDTVRFLSSDVALSEGTVQRKEGAPKPETRFSMVLVKHNGAWLISSATETALASQSALDPLKDLSWLIGDWSAENNGASVHMKAEWAANKNFITCRYEIKKSAATAQEESRQVIGWDPRTEQPISWHFDTNGGFGYGNWIKKDRQWMVDASGVDRDGSTTTATNILSISDPNSFSFQSVNRSINGVGFNDTVPLKVQRVVK